MQDSSSRHSPYSFPSLDSSLKRMNASHPDHIYLTLASMADWCESSTKSKSKSKSKSKKKTISRNTKALTSNPRKPPTPRRSVRLSNLKVKSEDQQSHSNQSFEMVQIIDGDKTPKKKKKKRKRTVLKKNTVSDSETDFDSRMTPRNKTLIVDEIEESERRGAKFNKNNRWMKMGASLLEGPCGAGWTKEQEIALYNAYYSLKPSTYFWARISRKVPCKTSKECFDRFYSAHPTPPCSQPQSRAKSNSKYSPIRPFANEVNSLLNSGLSKSGRSSNGSQKMLKARKTVRTMLRRNKWADNDYETDLFSALEKELHLSSVPQAKSPVTPYISNQTREKSTGGKTWSSSHTKTLSRFSRDAGCNLQKQFMSPEVLKPVKNQHLHDKYIDLLHNRDLSRRNQMNNSTALAQPNAVSAAKASVVADAQKMLEWSYARQCNALDTLFDATADEWENERDDEEEEDE